LRVVFIGVVSIGWHCLRALTESGANVVGIFSSDPAEMAAVSGMHRDYFGDFDSLAAKYGVPLYRTDTVREPLDAKAMRELKPDLIYCVGWPQIIKREVWQLPTAGCVAIHPTLLPERRGGAPLNWCLIDGLSRSGVTLFYLNEEVDSGDIIAQTGFDISPEDTVKTLLDKTTDAAVSLVREWHPRLESGTAPRIPQDDSRATYTRRRSPDDGLIDWRRTSLSVYNLIRALTLPFPGAYTSHQGRRIIVRESELLRGYKPRFEAKPGEILTVAGGGIIITTSDSAILIRGIEIDGRSLDGNELAKHGIIPGIILGGE